jgi:ribosome biogenesis GTPase A
MAVYGLVYLAQKYPSRLKERYNLDDLDTSDEGLHLIEEIARKRGFIQKGARIDYERTITYVLNDIRSNKLGAISFEESE